MSIYTKGSKLSLGIYKKYRPEPVNFVVEVVGVAPASKRLETYSLQVPTILRYRDSDKTSELISDWKFKIADENQSKNPPLYQLFSLNFFAPDPKKQQLEILHPLL